MNGPAVISQTQDDLQPWSNTNALSETRLTKKRKTTLVQKTLFGTIAVASSVPKKKAVSVKATAFTSKSGTIVNRKAHQRRLGKKRAAVDSTASPPLHVLEPSVMTDRVKFFGKNSKTWLILKGVLRTEDDIKAYECARACHLNDVLGK
eukprot:scaffold1203_cov117-Cylindrotheca_fusiformis.AAC.18